MPEETFELLDSKDVVNKTKRVLSLVSCCGDDLSDAKVISCNGSPVIDVEDHHITGFRNNGNMML